MSHFFGQKCYKRSPNRGHGREGEISCDAKKTTDRVFDTSDSGMEAEEVAAEEGPTGRRRDGNTDQDILVECDVSDPEASFFIVFTPNGEQVAKTSIETSIDPHEDQKEGQEEAVDIADGCLWPLKVRETKRTEERDEHFTMNRLELHCNLCGNRFERKSLLMVHIPCYFIKHGLDRDIELEPETLPFACELCPKRFKELRRLTRHLSVHVDENLYECNFCRKGYNKKEDVLIHLRTHTGMPYECEECGKCFNKKRFLSEHLLLHSGEKPFHCDWPHCGQSVRSASGFRDHMMRHKQVKPHQCPDGCGASFVRMSELRIHAKRHHSVQIIDSGSERQVDRIKQKSSKSRGQSLQTENCHSQAGPVVELEENSEAPLNNSQEVVSNANHFTFSDDLIGGPRIEQLLNDVIVASDVTSQPEKTKKKDDFVRMKTKVELICDFCHRIYSRTSSLLVHFPCYYLKHGLLGVAENEEQKRGKDLLRLKFVVPKELLVECDVCEKKFKDLKNLTRHVAGHVDIDAFECTICGKGFHVKEDAVRHIRVHIDERPHECSHCGKRFIKLFALREHVNTHTGEKPFACDWLGCGHRVSSHSALRDHLKRHKREKNYKCPEEECGASFVRKSELRIHLERHHSENGKRRKTKHQK